MRDVMVIAFWVVNRVARAMAVSIVAGTVAGSLFLIVTWHADHRRIRDRIIEIVSIWMLRDDSDGATRFRVRSFPGGRVVTAKEQRGTSVSEYCYVDRYDETRGMKEILQVARRERGAISWSAVSEAQSRPFGLTAEALTTLARNLCSL